MRWAFLFLLLTGLCMVIQFVRGVARFDGVALLGLAFLILAAIVGFVTRAAEKREMRRRYPR